MPLLIDLQGFSDDSTAADREKLYREITSRRKASKDHGSTRKSAQKRKNSERTPDQPPPPTQQPISYTSGGGFSAALPSRPSPHRAPVAPFAPAGYAPTVAPWDQPVQAAPQPGFQPYQPGFGVPLARPQFPAVPPPGQYPSYPPAPPGQYPGYAAPNPWETRSATGLMPPPLHGPERRSSRDSGRYSPYDRPERSMTRRPSADTMYRSADDRSSGSPERLRRPAHTTNRSSQREARVRQARELQAQLDELNRLIDEEDEFDRQTERERVRRYYSSSDQDDEPRSAGAYGGRSYH